MLPHFHNKDLQPHRQLELNILRSVVTTPSAGAKYTKFGYWNYGVLDQVALSKTGRAGECTSFQLLVGSHGFKHLTSMVSILRQSCDIVEVVFSNLRIVL